MLGMMKESRNLPIHVKLWMAVMVVTFAAQALYFDSYLHVTNLVTFLITVGLFAPLSFTLTRNINVLAATHFIAWPTVLAYGVYQVYLGQGPAEPVAMVVLLAAYAVFFVSLVLDYRILLQELSKSRAQ
ncbi:hypothetical protein [uncultured Litoreibacter sp.]|uniref:hypothetical protein n=1 Tax=uncultured Litoreibacter sp. TaxID=1392394 RepID=UPI00262EF889|nr:hypothetical protein [uncultured Litoreibacter sp.]